MIDHSKMSDEELQYELTLCTEILTGDDGLRSRWGREEYSDRDTMKYAMEVWEYRRSRAESELMSRFLLG